MLKRIITTSFCLLAVALYVTPSTSAQKSAAPTIKHALAQSLPLLESIRVPFLETTGCVSCHHNSLPAMAVATAREHGFPTNEQVARAESEQILALLRPAREKLLQGDSFAGADFNAAFTLVGLAANGQAPNATTDALVHYLFGRQLADGRWQALGSGRPPLDSVEVNTTALALRALQLYAPPGLRQATDQRIARARAWLLQTTPQTLNEQNFQLLGLAWAKADAQTLQKKVQALLAQQRPDGGWNQLSTLASDAFATGQALVALQAGGLPVRHRAYQRGVKYLLDTQLPDGSWLVQTRAYPVQKYFESGFPHKHNQWISAAATSWATMALALTEDAKTQLSGRN